MIYLFQVTVYSAAMLLIYLLFLRNRPLYQFSRYYLLATVVLPLAIPFIKIAGVANRIPEKAAELRMLLPEVTVFSTQQVAAKQLFTTGDILLLAYLAVSLVILIVVAYQYFTFRRFVRRHRSALIENVHVLFDTKSGPGSFLHYIFVPDDQIDPLIFEHELAHVRLNHSFDILLIRLFQILFWPNIVLHFILKELKIVHEFQSDAYAAGHKEKYITTLLNNSFNTDQFSLSHTFFYHPLKRRIMMLQMKPFSRMKMANAVVKTGICSAMLFLSFIYMQSCKTEREQPKKDDVSVKKQASMNVINEPTKTAAAPTEQPKKNEHTKAADATLVQLPTQPVSEVYSIADVMPAPIDDVPAFLSGHLKYPESARQKGAEGRVIVQFIVSENGDILQPEIKKSPDSSLSAEALRVVNMLPKWKPGIKNGQTVAVRFTLPILFKLDNGGVTELTKPGEVTISPNPTKGSIHFQGTTNSGKDEEIAVTLADLAGTVVYNKTIMLHNGQLNEEIQLSSSAPDGMYVLKLKSASFDKVYHVLLAR